jgi:hypothetical protein
MSGSDALTVLGPPVAVAYLGFAPQEPSGPPTCLPRLSTPTTRLVDPGRPSGSSPNRFLWISCWSVKTIAGCMSRDHGAVSSVGASSPSCGLRGALGTLHLARSGFTSSTGATRGRSGGLDRTPQGLAPCQKRQASLGALTPHAQRRGPLHHPPLTGPPSRDAPLSPRPLQRLVSAPQGTVRM